MKTITSEILGKQFKYEIKHVSLQVNDDLWQHDKWVIIINDEVFDYSTGIGHRKAQRRQGGMNPRHTFKELMNGNHKKTYKNLTIVNELLAKVSRPTPPTIDDVLYSLVIDADSAEGNFHDWCDYLGYDTDSRKALGIYEACCNIRKKVQQLGINLVEANEAFEDY